MALRAIMLRRDIERKQAQLNDLREKDGEFQTREAELETAINEAETDEQRDAVAEEVETFETERTAHEEATATLTREIEELESQLQEEERKAPQLRTPEHHEERKERAMINVNINIRSLPMSQRVFEAIPQEQRASILAQEDTKTFLQELRSMKGQTRAVSGGELTIPVTFLDLIAENMYRYSKLMNRVRVRPVQGQARQTIAGTVPEAVWTEMCANINELEFSFNQVTVDGYKVAGIIPVCNALLEDNDVNLASTIIEMMSESIGLAKDKAILYGKGASYKMPLGVVTRLAQTAKPDGYPADAPEWVDLHETNILTIAANKTGAEFWAALRVATGNTFTRYSRGEQSWCMNSKTYALLESKAIATTATGEWVALIGGRLPIVSGNIDVLEFMPDNDIVGGYFDLYVWSQRAAMTIAMDESGYINRLKDQTVFFGKERADGMPVIPGAFVAINIAGSTPTTTVTFASDDANSVTSIAMNTSTASVAVDGTVQLRAITAPGSGDVTWTSATPAKATVSNNGLVTGVAAGSSVITATCNGLTASCTVTVTAS